MFLGEIYTWLKGLPVGELIAVIGLVVALIFGVFSVIPIFKKPKKPDIRGGIEVPDQGQLLEPPVPQKDGSIKFRANAAETFMNFGNMSGYIDRVEIKPQNFRSEILKVDDFIIDRTEIKPKQKVKLLSEFRFTLDSSFNDLESGMLKMRITYFDNNGSVVRERNSEKASYTGFHLRFKSHNGEWPSQEDE